MSVLVSWLVYVNNSTGEINHLESYNEGHSRPDGTVTEDGYTIIYMNNDEITALDGVVYHDDFTSKYWRKGNAWTKRTVRPTPYYKWNKDSEAWVLDQTELLSDARLRRDSELYRTDWTQVGDNPLSDSKKAEYVTYRQQLRDLMSNISNSVDDESKVPWPTQPS